MLNLDVVKSIKYAFDWISYVEENHAVQYANGGRELRICCPSCGDSKFKCYINPEKGAFICFKCDFRTGKYFDLFDFVALTEGITKGQALMRLVMTHKPLTPEDNSFFFRDDYEFEYEDRTTSSISLPPEAKLLNLENSFSRYLKGRGFTDAEFEDVNIHFVPDLSLPVHDSAGVFKGDIGRRLLLPVYGDNGTMVSWQARVVPGVTPERSAFNKYLNCPETDINSTLWPYCEPLSTRAVLVEGIFDAVSVRRVPGVSSYCTFSKKISTTQIELLKSWGIESVVLWFDKKDAKSSMISTIETLKMHFKNVYVPSLKNWPASKDTGDMMKEENGTESIREALADLIDVYSWEYEEWKFAF